jgi:1-acyl-sn-glycerol-3-phosphate acyltransferase
MNLLKYLNYGLYMIIVMPCKMLKHKHIKKTRGIGAGKEYCAKIGEDWARFTINTAGINITVKGKENIPNSACCYIGNHTSILDIPILINSVGKCMGFIAKKEMAKVPILGYLMKEYNCVALDRENVREGLKAIKEGANNLKSGYSMAIFPEGTRSKDGRIREFKKGSLKLATMAKAPVVPVAISGAYRAYEENRKFKPVDITVTFSKPIYTENLTREEEKELMDKVRSIIASNLEQE